MKTLDEPLADTLDRLALKNAELRLIPSNVNADIFVCYHHLDNDQIHLDLYVGVWGGANKLCGPIPHLDLLPMRRWFSDNIHLQASGMPIATTYRAICVMCYHPISVSFVVADEMWTQVIPPKHQDDPICLTCFARLADESLIPWDQGIKLTPHSLAAGFVQSKIIDGSSSNERLAS